jgi:hypothetical protein
MFFSELSHKSLEIDPAELATVLLNRSSIERFRQFDAKVLRPKGTLRSNFLLLQFLKQIVQRIGLEHTRRQRIILGKLMYKSSKFLSHEQTLHKSVDITRISQIFKPTISKTNLPLLPILLFILNGQLPNRQLIKNIMNHRSVNTRIITFFYLMQKTFRSFTKIGKSIFVESIKFYYTFINTTEVYIASNYVETKVVSEKIYLFTLETFTIAETYHEVLGELYVSLEFLGMVQPQSEEFFTNVP